MQKAPGSVRSRSHGGPPLFTAVVACVLGGLTVRTCEGAGYDSLSQVEAASETRDYTQQIATGKFGKPQEAFLTEILLPQLSKAANRTAITRTRQRIRELALRDAAADVVDPVNSKLRDAMLAQARDADNEAVVRVNAMLLVGELVSGADKPWPGAGKPLAEAAADASLPWAVRIVALAALGRHVAEAGGGSPALVAAAGPVVAGLLTSPPEGDAAARRWILARSLDMLPALSPPPAAIAVAVRMLGDQKEDPDLRVRAAVALGRLARPDAGIDAAAGVEQVRGLAIAVLEGDLAAADARRFARKLGSRDALLSGADQPAAGGQVTAPLPPTFGGGFGVEPIAGGDSLQPLDPDAVPTAACRRDAWRLFSLADAIKPTRGSPGLADLLSGEKAAAAADLATTLHTAAKDLDRQADEASLKQALDAIKEAARAGAGPQPAGGDARPASPFDEPANGPF